MGAGIVLHAEEQGRNDLGVIEYQYIAFVKVVW